MKRSKKLIGIVLSLILAISITATIFIATANTKETDIIITVDKAELSAGERATVSVKVTSNYPIATMSIPVFYDKTLVDVSDVTVTLTDYAVKSAITNAESKDASKVYANTGINSDKFGFVLATYIGGAGKEVPETTDNVILTFKITAKTGVSGTETIKCVSQSAKTDENIAGMLYFGATTNGKSIDSIPENIENIDLTLAQANVKIGAEPNTLVVRQDFNGAADVIIDKVTIGLYLEWLGEDFVSPEEQEATGLIYGVEVYDYMLTDALTTTYGDDYLVVTQMETADGYDATGSMVEVLDEDGNVIETYYFIYFGDVDCNGLIDLDDITGVSVNAKSGDPYEKLVQFIAADADANTYLELDDITAVVVSAKDGELLDQAGHAATFYEGILSAIEE